MVVVVVDGLGGGGGKEDHVVGWSGNLSGTYWVIVIRPRLSRTATTSVWDTGDRPVTVLNRSEHSNSSVCSIILHDARWKKMQTRKRKKHVELAQSTL